MAELQAAMSQAEYERWMAFYRLYPFDDGHRYHRPAALISTALGGGDLQARLEWLAPEPVPPGYSDADMSIFRAFGVRPPSRK